jgi:hypothetical protein
MDLSEKKQKLQAIVSEQKKILERKIGGSNIFSIMEYAELKYLEAQKNIILAIPTSKTTPDYAKGDIVGDSNEYVGNYPYAFENTSTPIQTSIRGISCKEFGEAMSRASKGLNIENRKPAN